MKVKMVIENYTLQDIKVCRNHLKAKQLSDEQILLIDMLLEKEESELRKAQILSDVYG